MSRRSNSSNLQFLLSEIRDYMLTQEKMESFTSEISDEENIVPKKISKYIQKLDKKSISLPNNHLFIPIDKDTLFWCFYIMQNSLIDYEMLFEHKFKEEKVQKIKMVELIREHKALLKTKKWKRIQIEDDLVNQKVISISTFLCLCAIQKLNIILIKNKYYYTDVENKGDIHIVEYTDTGYGLYLLNKQSLQDKKNFCEKNYWWIDNWNKPLKAISNYKIKQLQEICIKLELPIEYNLTTGLTKRMKKKDLYYSIKQTL